MRVAFSIDETKEKGVRKMGENQTNDKKEMSDDLKGWGLGLLVMGFLHLKVSFLSPEWGVVLIFMGIIVLLIRHRGMYILLGMSLVVVGLMNISSAMVVSSTFWPIFGCLQIYWGLKEMAKFSKYRKELPVNEASLSQEKQMEAERSR